MYFHLTMSQSFQKDELEAMKSSEMWGLCATDVFGMVRACYNLLQLANTNLHRQGMDLPDVQLVIQWKVTCDLCTLRQKFWCGGWGSDQLTTPILLVEKKDTDKEHLQKAECAAKKKAKKRKGIRMLRQAKDQLNMQCCKHPALANRSMNPAGVNDPYLDHNLDIDGDVDVEMEDNDIEGDQGTDGEWCTQYQKEGRSRL